jgi:hypothetical protein
LLNAYLFLVLVILISIMIQIVIGVWKNHHNVLLIKYIFVNNINAYKDLYIAQIHNFIQISIMLVFKVIQFVILTNTTTNLQILVYYYLVYVLKMVLLMIYKLTNA